MGVNVQSFFPPILLLALKKLEQRILPSQSVLWFPLPLALPSHRSCLHKCAPLSGGQGPARNFLSFNAFLQTFPCASPSKRVEGKNKNEGRRFPNASSLSTWMAVYFCILVCFLTAAGGLYCCHPRGRVCFSFFTQTHLLPAAAHTNRTDIVVVLFVCKWHGVEKEWGKQRRWLNSLWGLGKAPNMVKLFQSPCCSACCPFK